MELLNSLEASSPLSRNKSESPAINSSIKVDDEYLGKEVSSCPKTLLILDTETTGLDPSKDSCIEIGSILFDVATRSVLAQQSFLIPSDTNDAQAINKIPAEITHLEQAWSKGLDYFSVLTDCSDVLLAHNSAFDRKWFGKKPLPVIDKPWICSMEDIKWPSHLQISNRPSVRDLALAYGIPVWNAHRALTDCIYLAEVLKRCEDLETLLTYALEPRQLVKAKVSYEDRLLAKKAGFRWNDPVPGAWTRRMSEREISALNFSVSPIDQEVL